MTSLEISVKSFGALGDGVTDDTNAFIMAFNTLLRAGGGLLYVPCGVYRISQRLNIQPTAQEPISIRGAGRYLSTLDFSGSASLGILFNSSSRDDNHLPKFEVRDLGLITSRDNCGTAIEARWATANNLDAPFHATDLHIAQNINRIADSGSGYGYWTTGVVTYNARNSRISNVHFYGEMNKSPGTAFGFLLDGESTCFKISDSLVLESTTGIRVQGSCEGVYVHNCDLVGVRYGFYAEYDTGAEPQMTFTDSHVNATNVGVWLKNCQQSVVSNCVIYACSWLDTRVFPEWRGVLIQGANSRFNKVTGCTFSKEGKRIGDICTGIDFNEGRRYSASGNHFFGFPANQLTYGIQVRPGVTNVIVGNDNVYEEVTRP